MRYTQPTLVSLGKASAAIQGSENKSLPRAPDANPHASFYSTGSAYDLDE